MNNTRAVFLVLIASLVSVAGVKADSIQFREGGESGYVDLAFDDTYVVVSPPDNTTHGNRSLDGLQMETVSGSPTKVVLIAAKDLLTVLPRRSGDLEIQIQAADLHLFGFDGSEDQTIFVNRVSSDWLSDPAGSNENDVSGLYAEVSSFGQWFSGWFSTDDWVSTVTASGPWAGGSDAETVINITALIAGIYTSERNYGLVLRCGEGFATARSSEHQMRPTLGITYVYGPGGPTHVLTVNGGSGDGQYSQGLVVDVSADPGSSGMVFDEWIGDTAYVAAVDRGQTTITMPGMPMSITATYKPIPTCTLTVNSGSGSGQYEQFTVIPIVAFAAPSGHVFCAWSGDVAGIADPGALSTTITMPGTHTTITATYFVPRVLTVNSGIGSGTYSEGTEVDVVADTAPSGHSFSQWVGDTDNLNATDVPEATLTIPAGNSEITATYTDIPLYYLTVNSGTGDGIYSPGTLVDVVADPAASGYVFNMWIGDPDGFADWDATKMPESTYTIPDRNMTLTATYRPTSSPTDWSGYFDIFCKETFGAEKEPLAYEMFGSDLVFMAEPESEWLHVSKTSACVTFETNLPADSYVEYGTTTAYGSRTPARERYYYLHIYHLRDLDADTTYHYRFVAEDERGNMITSDDKTFTTATPANVIYVPGQMGDPPYDLDQTGKTYLLTQDITVDRTAFNILADNVTLDLGGHTVIYNQEDYQVTHDYRDTSSMGVRAIDRTDVRVLNGVIRQGLGYNTGSSDGSLGYSPVTMWNCAGELAGISIDYAGIQVTGFKLDYSPLVAHHCVILDRGGDVDDRHLAPKAIQTDGPVHHVLVRRQRQIALNAGDDSDYYNNEIYVDSCATNGSGIGFYRNKNCQAYGNRIFGTGYLMIGISAVSSGVEDIMVHDNFVHLYATRPDTRWGEYGAQSGAYCFRITSYSWSQPIDNVCFYDNVAATYARDGGMVRGTWFTASRPVTDCSFDSNILKAVCHTLDSDIQGCIVHVGSEQTDSPPIVYSNNRLISNFCNARMGEDYYAAGQNAEFYNNTFVKVGPERPDYRTIGVGYGWFMSTGHKFYDSTFEGGAGYDQIRFDGYGERNFSVGWSLIVRTDPGAQVSVKDVNDQTVYTGTADGNGVAATRLLQYLEEPDPTGRTMFTPHTVTVQKGAQSLTEEVTMDDRKTLLMYLSTQAPPLGITEWASCSDHGTAGEGLLAISDDGAFSEPRAGGIKKLMLTFDKAIDAGSFVPSSVLVAGKGSDGSAVDLAGITISTSTRNGDTQGVITFTPQLPDYARYYVRVSDVTGTDGGMLAGDTDRLLTALVGDVSGDLAVDSGDLTSVRYARAAPIDLNVPEQVRADVSCDARVNATDLSRVRSRFGNDASAIQDPPVRVHVYQEQDGFVAFEAEQFYDDTPGATHSWYLVTAPEGYLGDGAMQTLPNIGTTIDGGYLTEAARLDYKVNFQTTGKYYVWVRGFAASTNDDSCHISLDEVVTPTAERIGGFAYGEWDHWDWSNYSMSEPVAYIEILYAGLHTISLCMREDGLIVDKIILTKAPGYTPPE